MGPCGAVWGHVGPYGALWGRMGRACRAVWAYKYECRAQGSSEALNKECLRPIMEGFQRTDTRQHSVFIEGCAVQTGADVPHCDSLKIK